MTSSLMLAMFCLAAAHAVSGPTSQPVPSSRPNIIFLLTDDQRDNALGAMGHPFVKTPHLDRLMHQSVRFRNTYIASPVCTARRWPACAAGTPRSPLSSIGDGSNTKRLCRCSFDL